MKGIYAYVDTMDNSVVYVGKDSYIDKGKRRRDHMLPSTYNHQRFNRVLQNNPSRYEYKEIFVFDEISNTELNHLEMQQIALFNPKFNFTKGGDGFKGGKQSEESRRKISENHADLSKENHPRWKPYARVVKAGTTSKGKKRYGLRHNGEWITMSIFKEKLEKMAEEINKKEGVI